MQDFRETWVYGRRTTHACVATVGLLTKSSRANKTLVLKTTYKIFLKYQVNTRFPSFCLASENVIFGGGRRTKVGKPIGDAPMTPKIILNPTRSNVHHIHKMYVLLVSTRPKLQSVSLYDQTFSRYRPFWDKCTEWQQNDLEPYKVKCTPYVLLVSPSHKLHSFLALLKGMYRSPEKVRAWISPDDMFSVKFGGNWMKILEA